MNIAVIYASKGKSTQEIANTIIFFSRFNNLEAESVVLHDAAEFPSAAQSIAKADVVAFGSPTYDNGQPMREMISFFRYLTEAGVELSGKGILVFGAYGWGICESVDYLIQKSQELGGVVFPKEHLPGYVGLRLHTREILFDDVIVSYLKDFLEFQRVSTTFCMQSATDNFQLKSGQKLYQGIKVYRKKTTKASDFDGAVLENCQFLRVDFSGIFLERTIFRNCTFWYSTFDHSSLNNVVFECCDITNCSFRNVSFQKSSLIESDLSESHLSESDLLYINLDRVRMDNIVFNEAAQSKPTSRKVCSMIEKHERNQNYFAAAKIHKQLYINAKSVNNHELSELFYIRMMENQRKLYFRQSIFYRIYLFIIDMLHSLFHRLRFPKLSNVIRQTRLRLKTQTVKNISIENTSKYIMLLVFKIITGNRNSITRLIKFCFITIAVSTILLFFVEFRPNVFTIGAIWQAILECLNRSLHYLFGIGMDLGPPSMPLSIAVYYLNGGLGIIISAIFSYILIEKLTR